MRRLELPHPNLVAFPVFKVGLSGLTKFRSPGPVEALRKGLQQLRVLGIVLGTFGDLLYARKKDDIDTRR